MKKFSVFESAVIGLFIGVIIATYVTFLNSTGGYVGKILGGVALLPVLDSFNLPIDKTNLVVPFIFIVAIFIAYGAIIGLIMKIGRKAVLGTVSVLILIPFGALIEQSLAGPVASSIESAPIVAAVVRSQPKAPEPEQQYFGNEVKGDLNGDSKDDVAFVIIRNEKERGALYYLVASLATSTGHLGTNLLYLGDKIEPTRIGIDSGLIYVDYIDHSSKKLASTTKKFFAQLTGGELAWVKLPTDSNKDKNPAPLK